MRTRDECRCLLYHSYEDNDPSKAAPSTQAPPAPVVAASHPPADDYAHVDVSQYQDQGGAEPMNQDQDDDDDDDVDFNLGGGGGGGYSNMNQGGYAHDDAPTPPPLGTVHKASAKEDG